jgi:hypothetical protein
LAGKDIAMEILDPLSRLAVQHGTDKYGAHQYTPHYHRLFSSRRDQPIRLLEIGIGGYGLALSGGQSLRMWADYFPYGQITGLDIEEKRMAMPPRVTMLQGSQADSAFLAQVCAEHGPFDIIIDDGSHQVAHVLTSFHALYPNMAADGLYVVEDTQTAFWPGMGGNPTGNGSIFDVAHEIALAIHDREQRPSRPETEWHPYGAITSGIQIFRNIVVFERGANRFPSNADLRIEDPLVAQMMDILGAESRRNPAPGPFLIQIDLTSCANRFDLAVAALLEGLAAYPFDTGLLLAGIRLFNHLQAREHVKVLVGRLTALYPDDPSVARLAASF